MQYQYSVTLIEHGEERVQFWCAKILPLHVRSQLNAVSLQRIECIDDLADGSIDIGKRQGSTEEKPSGMLLLQPGSGFVALADKRLSPTPSL